MEPKEKKALSKETDINDFEAERELIEEKHRTEVLNLLKCFEFERTDMETRFQERLEEKDNDGVSNETSVDQHEVDELREKLEREKDELQEQFDKEKASLMARLKKLEGEVVVKRESDSVGQYEDDHTLSREFEVDKQRTEEKGLAVLKATDSHHEWTGESSAQEVQKDESKTSTSIASRNTTGDQQFYSEDYNSRSSENGMKSLRELKEENHNLKQELDDQSSEIGELQNQVNHLSRKLDDIRELFENEDVNAADKKEKLRELFEGCSTELTDGRHETRKEHGEASSPVGQQHRSSSEMSFVLEELNMENDDLKNNVYEMEQKIRRTIEENEMQRSVFKEKLDGIVEKLMESQSQEGQDSQLNESVVENTINELRGITLEETSQKLLLDYVNIVLSQKSGSHSSDVFDVNLLHEIQSLEQLLDLEIFDGRVFDEEMKDEVKQVLHDKERELMLAYTVEKLREELRNRFATETVLVELQKERKKDYFVNQAVNEVLKEHLGISTTGKDSEELEKALANNSQEEPRIPEEKIENGAIDVDALKAEKEELEGTLQELQDYFQKERQDWLQKLQSPLQEGSTQVDNKDKVIQSLRAQKVMEQVLNTERFYLSRLYYIEMKEELDASLKQYRFERGGKLEKERVTEAWRHHVEVGELYQEILQKETESIENMKEKINEEERKPEICESPEVSSEDELRKENLRLEIQLPMKLELAELQRKRCREHKAVSLILEQAVTAVETAVQEQDAFLVNSDFLQRRSSWPSSDDDTAMPEGDFTEPRFSGATRSDKENKNGNGGAVNESSINSKGSLRKALGRLLEKLLNEQPVKDSEPDSCASDSDFSELEDSPRRDQSNEDEITVKKKKFETSDVLSDDSPRGSLSDLETEAAKEVETEGLELKDTPKISKVTSKSSEDVSRDSEDMSKDPESMSKNSEYMSKDSEYKSKDSEDMAKDSEDMSKDAEGVSKVSENMSKDSDDASKNFQDSSKGSVPEIFKLSPKIDNLLNIERFNMSRLLRDEYVDKIRRGRRKIRRMRAQNYDNNEELLTKFKEHVGLLLDKTDLGEGGEEKGDVEKKRLASTPSDDSGIADFVESDKDAVVRKYKELLEKARKDLNRAHTAMREKPGRRNENEISNELGAMKRNLKEKENDLKELGDKRVGLENERKVLLGKIKSATDPTNGAATDSETKTGDDFGQVVKEQHDSQSPLAIEIKAQTDQQLSQLEPFSGAIGADDGAKLAEASPEAGVPEDRHNRIDLRHRGSADKGFDTTTGSEVERGLLVRENEELKGKLDALEEEMESKDKEFYDENKKKQDEVNELQRKLVEGTGGEDILLGLQEKLNEANEEKRNLEAKCSEIEKRKRQGELGSEKKYEEDAAKEITRLQNENAILENEIKLKQEKVDELRGKMMEGVDGEEIVKELQLELKELNEKNRLLENTNKELAQGGKGHFSEVDKVKVIAELERENKTLGLENQETTKKLEKLQQDVLAGTGSEAILEGLQDEVKDLKVVNKDLEKKCYDLEENKKETYGFKGKDMKQLEKELERANREKERLDVENKSKEEEIADLQKKLVEGSGGEELLENLQQQVKELKDKDAELEMHRQNLEDLNEELKNKEIGNGEMGNEISKIKEENVKLTDENKTKDSEVRELQKALVEGSGGEEILQKLQDKIKESEEKNKMLEKQCRDVSNDNEDLEKKENEARNEKKERATELARIKKENDYLERASEVKTGEITKLQEKLLDGTGGEEILKDLQGQMKELEDMNKELRKKCNEMEAREETSKDDEVNKEKELSELKRKNERLLLDNNEKEKEVSDLQNKLVEGTGGEELLESLQQQVKELKQKDTELEIHCQKLEDLNEELKNKEIGNTELEKEISKIKKENAKLTDENKTKDSEVRELQKALVEGSGGEEILQKLQDKIKETEENNKMLEKQCRDLSNDNEDLEKKENEARNEKKEMATELARIKKDNDYLERESQAKTGEISKLLEKLLDGTGGEEILQELQGQMKELEDMNKELRKKCNEMEVREETSKGDEDDVNKEKEKELSELKRRNERLLVDNNEKENEVSDLQKKLVEGTGGEELLESLQQQVKELKQKDTELEIHCQKLEDVNEELKNKEIGNTELEKEISKIKDENAKLTDENKTKDNEVRELQKALVEGSGGEEVLQKLQDKIKETEENNKMLEKQCRDLSNDNENLEKKENDARTEKKEMATELARIKKENDYLERESEVKTGEITKLQEKLLDGTGGQEILKDLQGQMKELEDMNKELRKKCNEMEAREETSKQDEDDVNKEKQKELSELKRKNERLLVENNEKEKEVSDLQKKLAEGSGGEELLESLQQQVKELKDKDAELEIQCQNLEDLNEELKNKEIGNTELEKEISKIKEENAKLADENKTKDSEVRELQKALVEGSGGEEILQKLQDKIKETEENNKMLEKQCRDLSNDNEDLEKKEKDARTEKKEMATELARIKKENDYLERESQAKTGEITKLQGKLLDGTGGEEILQELQGQMKELDDMNNELRKKNNEMEAREETSKDGAVNKEKELFELKRRNERLLVDNNEKENEVSDLQKKLVEGTGGEELLESLQQQVKELKQKDTELEIHCQKLEDVNEELKNKEIGNTELEKEISKTKDENAKLTDENKTKDNEVRELQKALVEGSGGEEVLQKLQDKIKETEENNKMLEKQCRDLSNDNENLEKKENDARTEKKEMATELARIKKENDYLERESEVKTGEITKLQEKLLDGTGGQEILKDLQGQMKELEDMNKELRKKCNEMEAREETSKQDEDDVNKEKQKELSELKRKNERLLVENNEKEKEVSDLQKKLVEGTGGEELLESLQQQVKELKQKDTELEIQCQKLEDLNEELKNKEICNTELEKEISKIKEENAKLTDENKTKDNEVRELQKALVEGSGGEEILQKLQDKIKESEEKNKMLEKQCRDVSNDNEDLEKKENDARNEKKEMATELASIKKENDYLERESQAKTGEITKLQEKLLDGTGGEEILQDLQGQMKELEDMNKELRKKNNEMEAREETSKEDEVNKEKELSELKRKNERLLVDNNEKEKEVSDLQKKLVEGTGGEELLESLQQQVKELKQKDTELEIHCQKLEDLNEELKNKELGNTELENEISKMKEENAMLADESKTKDSEVRELQKALVEGSGGEEILQKLQGKIKETEENNKMLEKQCRDLTNDNEDLEKKENDAKNENKGMKVEVARIKKENDYLERESQAKTGEIFKLQEKLLDGTGGEEILQELQGQMKELKDLSKELRKKNNEMEAREETSKEDEVNKEKELSELKHRNERLLLDKNEKEKEVSDLQKKLVEGTGGEEILENIQGQLKKLEEKNEKLEADCCKLEDENKNLRGDESKRGDERDEILKLRKENTSLVEENEEKDIEVRELQKKLVDGSGGEEILEKLQDKVQELETNNKALEKQNGDLDIANQRIGKKDKSLKNENKEMKEEVARIKKENDYLERESQAKSDEISKLQKKLLDGTGGEEILQELQGQMKELEDMNKELRKKNNEMEARDETSKEDEVEKELSELKRKNERLLVDNNEKEKEVSDLQKKLVEGTGGEEILENIQGQLKKLKEKNEKLEAECFKLEDENENLRGDESKRGDERDEILKLRKETTSLVEENETKDIEVRELQKKLVDGSGGEEILKKLQDKVQELETNNKALEKQNGDLDIVNQKIGKEDKSLKNENKEMKEELVKIKKENDYLERENQTKSDEISKLQEKLLDGTGGEKILQELQGQMKELEDMNKELRKKNNEMEAREETSKDDEVNKEKELFELKRKNARLLVDNNEKEKEVSDLQKKLVEGTGEEEVLENIQGQLKKLKEKNEKLEADCFKLEHENENLRSDESKSGDERDEILKLRKENTNLVEENETKDIEVRELQKKLVDGSGGEEILKKLQDKVQELETNNKALEKQNGDLDIANQKIGKEDTSLKNENKEMKEELVKIKKENDYLERENQTKSDQISKLQEKLLDGTGGEKILQELQGQMKELEDMNKELRKKNNEMEAREETSKDDEVNKEKELFELKRKNARLLVDNNEKEKEVSDLQKKLVEGTGGEEVLENIQGQLKKLKEKNEKLEVDCCKLEDENENLRGDESKTGDERDEILKLRKENTNLVEENETKDIEVRELQKKLVDGSGGEEILEKLQDKVRELETNNKALVKQNGDLDIANQKIGKEEKSLKNENKEIKEEVARIKKENDYLERESQTKSDQISKLQEKLLDGTGGGEEILQELQGQMKDLEDMNKELRKKNNEMEAREETSKVDEVNKEKELSELKHKNERLLRDNNEKDKEVSDLQKKLVEGTGGEEVLENIQGQLKKLKEKNEKLEADCFKLEDENENLRSDESKSGDERDEILKLRKENTNLVEENETKDIEVRELQKKLVDGSGGEEILKKLQDKVQELETNNKALEKQNGDLDIANQKIGKEDTSLKNENKEMKEELVKIKKENDYLERENQTKSDQISKLQEKLLDGTGGEKILQELQGQMKELEDMNKELRKKNNEMEAREETSKDDEVNKEKELFELKRKNARLLVDNNEKEKEVSDLQKKLVEGTGGEEVLENIQGQLKKLKEKNEKLEADCCKLEDENENLRGDESKTGDERDEILKLRKENTNLVEENETKDIEVRELQKKLVDGSGGEEILEKLQDKVRELETNNKALVKQNGDLDIANQKIGKEEKSLKNENKEIKEEVARIKKENDYLERESQTKSDQISKLQEKLLDGTGGEEILQELQGQMKDLEDMNKELRKKNNEMEAREETSKVDEVNKEKELSELKHKNERLLRDNNEKGKEVSDLQKKLVEGTGGEEILENIQGQLKNLIEKNEELEADCSKLEDENENLRGDESKRGEERNEMSRLRKENTNLVEENGGTSKEDEGEINRKREKELVRMRNEIKRIKLDNKEKGEEIIELQNKLIEGTGAEEVLEGLQNQVKNLKGKNNDLETNCRDLEDVNTSLKDLESKEQDNLEEIFKLREENEDLVVENRKKDNEILDLQTKLISGTGGEEILQQLQNEVKLSKEKNVELKKQCRDQERAAGRRKEDDKILNEMDKIKNESQRLERENEAKTKKIGKLQQNVVKGTGSEEVVEELQNKVKELEDANKLLEETINSEENTKDSKQTIVKEGRQKRTQLGQLKSENDKLALKNNRKPEEGNTKGTKRTAKKAKKEGRLLTEKGGHHAGSSEDTAGFDGNFATKGNSSTDDSKPNDREEFDEIPSYDECVEIIPKITEERDHWRKKYKELRMKVGEQFVDIIPEVWSEEVELENERDETLSRLSEVKKEIAERESSLLKTMAENERLEKELGNVGDLLEDNKGQLEDLRGLQEQEEKNTKEQSRLKQSLANLESSYLGLEDLSLEEVSDEDKDAEFCSDLDERKERVDQVCQEVEHLLAEAEQNSENKRKDKNGASAMFDKKVEIKSEIKKLERAIEELQQGSSIGNNLSRSSRFSKHLESAGKQNSQDSATQDELDKISDGISELQSSLGASGVSNGSEVGNLVALMKEKSKLEDELSLADKALNKLGKRDYESLLKEREKQEKVAKKLLELSREKETLEGEFQEIEELVKTKETDLLSYFNSSKEKEQLGEDSTGKRKSSLRKMSGIEEDPVAISSEDNSVKDERENLLSSEGVLGVSEELGSLIQKKSSLAVRLESLGKEITTQSLKVEKSLLGVKEDPSVEITPGSSYSSLDDLSQSQLSIFDDCNMLDELSLATGLVKEERLKRKASRKTPMAKLLKEKAGLDKKFKDLEGKVLVQNAKIKNALRDGKDPGKFGGKFAQAVEERKKVEDELTNVAAKIDECKLQSDEVTNKGKLGKRRASTGSLGKNAKSSSEKKVGKSLSKNDKRLLLSQRESLTKQLDDVKRKIEDFSLDGDDGGLEDFPEMAEMRNTGSSYSGAVSVLRAEKEKKEAVLSGLEKDIEREKNSNSTKDDEKDLRKKRRAVKEKMERILEELEHEKQNLDTLKDSITNENETSLEKEQLLKDDIAALERLKEELSKELMAGKDSLHKQTTTSGQDSEQLSKEYQEFLNLKNDEEYLEKSLEDVNKRLLARKEWVSDFEQPKTTVEVDDSDLAQSYGEILKRMSDEKLNMADLIRELEVTQETLSKEREITGELLDLIKSRVGNELLGALTGDGLLSPLARTAEMHSTGAEEYQEVASKVEHDSVTVAEIIADYKKINALSQRENQKLVKMLELVKSKIDEDLFESIVNQKPSEVEVSKKYELSKILENNKTLFEQIVANTKAVRVLENENETLKMELEGGREVFEENKEIKEKLENANNEIGILTTELDEVKKEKNDELERNAEDFEQIEKELVSCKEMLEDLQEQNKSIMSKFEDATKRQDELKTNLQYMEEKKDSLEDEIEEINSKLQEAEEIKNEAKNELQKFKELTEETIAAMETEKNESVSKLELIEKLNDQMKNDLKNEQETKEENKALKEKLTAMENENKGLTTKLEDAEKEKYKTKEELQRNQADIEKENEEILCKLKETEKINEGLKNELELNERLKEENIRMKDKIDTLEIEVDNLNKEMTEELEAIDELKKENTSIKEMLDVLEKESNEVIPAMDSLKRTNKELEDEIEYLHKEEKDFESIQKKLTDAEREVEQLKEDLKDFESIQKKLADAEREVERLKEDLKDFESVEKKLTGAEREVERLKEDLKDFESIQKKLTGAEREVGQLQEDFEAIQKKLTDAEREVEQLKEDLKDFESIQKKLTDAERKVEQLKEDLKGFESVQKKLTDAERKVEQLKEDLKNFESIQNKLTDAEREVGHLKEDLEGLKIEKDELDNYIGTVLQRNVTGGLKSAVEDYSNDFKEMEKENHSLAIECDNLKELKQIIGKTLAEKLLSLSKEHQGSLEDTQSVPKCVEKVVNQRITLARVFEDYEKDLDTVEQLLGQELFSCILNTSSTLENDEDKKSLRIISELKDGKDLTQIVKAYEDLIESQANEIKSAEAVFEKVKTLEAELEDVHKQNQREIEEAEDMLREQRNQHELDKQNLLGRFNDEKNNMQHQIERERNSMETAMQNLINEIVRLKEERKEIRRNNRLEKEKMDLAFERERAELYSNNEIVKTDIQEKLEKAFFEVSQKEKVMMDERENGLKEEVMKLKNEKKEMAVKVKEMETKLEYELNFSKESGQVCDLKEKEKAREEIKNEFEETMKQEKKKFQDTLVSLRQEIDRLQHERCKAYDELTNDSTLNEQTDHSSVQELRIYERLESDFKAKIHSERISMENRIKELRKEREDLNKEKQEIKGRMRNQRLELNRKHEKEKEELVEKYRNEMRALREQLHKKMAREMQDNTDANTNRSFPDSQNIYELRRVVREKEAKLRRYETFFRELNQEASIFHHDPNIAV